MTIREETKKLLNKKMKMIIVLNVIFICLCSNQLINDSNTVKLINIQRNKLQEARCYLNDSLLFAVFMCLCSNQLTNNDSNYTVKITTLQRSRWQETRCYLNNSLLFVKNNSFDTVIIIQDSCMISCVVRFTRETPQKIKLPLNIYGNFRITDTLSYSYSTKIYNKSF